MRCRYSRKLYILKSQFHSPEYIDDEDLYFIENLIKFHKDYVDNFNAKMNVDSSLLKDKYRSLFNYIVDMYPQVSHTERKTALFKSLDLEYKGDERHTRDMREQIIYFLERKKGQIFTNRRVDFFMKLSLTTSPGELQNICTEMLFDTKQQQKLIATTCRKSAIENKSLMGDNLIILVENIHPSKTPFENMETILSPYIKMDNPPCCLDYEFARKKIANICSQSPPIMINEEKPIINSDKKQLNIINTEVNYDKQNVELLNEKLLLQPTVLIECLPGLVNSDITSKILTPIVASSKSLRQSKLLKRKNSASSIENTIPVQKSGITTIAKEDLSSAHKTIKLPHGINGIKRLDNASVAKNILTPSNQTNQCPLNSDNMMHKYSKEVTQHPPVGQMKQIEEIIVISDDEDDTLANAECPSSKQNNDQMIDFLTHRCSIQTHLHPSLLKDHQLKIELNGFLLFVNLSIRLSLRISLETDDRQIFQCIFISSITVGLQCSSHVTAAGIIIEKLSDEHFNVAMARITSTKVLVRRVREVDGLHSVLVDSDLRKLSQLALAYVDDYHSTGNLVAADTLSDENI